VQLVLKAVYWSRVGHGLDPSMDSIGLDWVRIFRELYGFNWIRLDDGDPFLKLVIIAAQLTTFLTNYDL